MLTSEQGNQLLLQYLSKNEPFYVGRVGINELNAILQFIDGKEISANLVYELETIAGLYGVKIQDFCKEYLSSIENTDVNVYWGHLDLSKQSSFFQRYAPNSALVHNRTVEPFYFENPWSYALEGKRVLVVHPFANSIESQYKNREKIWENEKILPKFDLVTYKSVQSVANLRPHSSWLESLSIMKDDISNIDFDVALLGCGSYGMPLASFIKRDTNRSSIYVGGGLQLMFGIMGNRWETHEIKRYSNQYWIRPSVEEKPPNYKLVENGSYW